MKYIKAYESQVNYLYADSPNSRLTHTKTSSAKLRKMGYPERFKFKLNDYVRIKTDIKSDIRLKYGGIFFQVKVIDASVGIKLIYQICAEPSFNTWVSEDEIELVPDYDVKTMKYNL